MMGKSRFSSLIIPLSLVWALGSGTKVWATLTVLSVSGASYYSIQPPNQNQTTTTPGQTTQPTSNGTPGVTIYGGLAGTCLNTPALGATCNTCDPSNTTACAPPGYTPSSGASSNQFPLCACNETAIYDNLQITITMQTDKNMTAPYAGVYITSTSPINTVAGDSISFSWASICGGGAAASTNPTGGAPTQTSGTCIGSSGQFTAYVYMHDQATTGNALYASGDDQVPITFQVFSGAYGGAAGGIGPGTTGASDSTDNVYNEPTAEGVGGFVPFPGDGRVYIIQLQSPGTFPTLGVDTGTATNLVVMASTTGLDNLNINNSIANSPSAPGQKGFALSIASGGNSLSNNVVDGLNNDQVYYFRVAVLDQANNMVQYFPPMDGLPPHCLQSGGANISNAGDCPYAAIPEQVLGMLDKDFNCFVATAAYGSSLEPKLKVFRAFRNLVLLRQPWGKKFVLDYYRYGPYAARFIADKSVLRWLARGLLWPAYGFSWLALRIGLRNTVVTYLIASAALMCLCWLAFRRVMRRA